MPVYGDVDVAVVWCLQNCGSGARKKLSTVAVLLLVVLLAVVVVVNGTNLHDWWSLLLFIASVTIPWAGKLKTGVVA